jgi:hypothetical protein
MRTHRTSIASCLAPLTALLLWVAIPAEEAQAQVAFGPQVNWGSEADFGIGGRLLTNLGGSNFELAGSVDAFFPSGDVDWLEFNANLFYHFHLPDSHSVLPYAGGGLNIVNLSAGGDSNTETGLNLGGGLRFPRAGATPFIEARGVISDVDQFVVTGGFLFGPTSFR